MNNNGTKQLLQKVLIYALVVIVGLVSTVFAITWKSTKGIAEKNAEEIVDIKLLLERQKAATENIDKQLSEIKDLLKK